MGTRVYDVVHHHGDDDVDRVMVPRGDQRERQRETRQPPQRAAKDVAEKDKAARVATEHEIVLVEKERCVQGRVLLVGPNARLVTRRERGQAYKDRPQRQARQQAIDVVPGHHGGSVHERQRAGVRHAEQE